jgi:two-component system chemotaxis response regulator CheB
VLVIDDNPDVRRLVRMLVEQEPAVELVGEARDGASGIRLAADTAPDLVIIDMQMPVMDGLTAIPEIRRAAPNAAIVMWSASAVDDQLEQQALGLGADAFIPKAGREPLAILDFIRAHCGGHCIAPKPCDQRHAPGP